MAILKLHARGVSLASETDLEVIAAMTPGFVGADLANLINEAALLAAPTPDDYIEDTVRATRGWLLATRPDDFDATVITTYPGTPYFDEAVETDAGVWTYTFPRTGDRLHSMAVDYRQVAEYYKGIPGSYRSFVYTDDLSAEDLVRMRDWLEQDVRRALNIPYPTSLAAIRYEHSMGQAELPANILRSSPGAKPRVSSIG